MGPATGTELKVGLSAGRTFLGIDVILLETSTADYILYSQSAVRTDSGYGHVTSSVFRM